MPGRKQYIFNPETLFYELPKTSLKGLLVKWLVIFLVASLCFLFYAFLYSRVFGLTSPKTALLERRNRELVSKMEMLDRHLEEDNGKLLDISIRDNTVYRPIFGMDPISAQTRNAGFGGMERYSYLEPTAHSEQMALLHMKTDVLTKAADIQARSIEEVSVLSKRAGEMASSVPNFNPVDMTTGRVGLSSPFGYRLHPVYNTMILHTGVDLNGPVGEPVYATGDGVVESVDINFYGYGNCILIDHGFGYKTRYAHLRTIHVFNGQKVSRGDQIATMGNSGRTTGSHLHYEVLYMGSRVNPWNYMNDDLTGEEYRSMVRPSAGAVR